MTVGRLVSIISPCYNGEKYLSDYLDSVLAQGYDNIELIVVDDASTDRTANILEEYAERFKQRGYGYIHTRLDTNSGQAAAINKGLKIFSGEYVTWMDADDIYFNDAIRKKVDFLINHPECEFVLNYGEVVYETDLDHPIDILRRIEPCEQDNLFKDLIDENNVVFCPGTILVKSDALRKAIPDLNIYESREGQNWQLMLPLAYSCHAGYLNEVLFKYVVHQDSHSHGKRSLKQEFERRDGFYKLQCETIDKIDTMPQNDKEYWKEYALLRSTLEKYRLAICHHSFLESLKVRRELRKQGTNVEWKDGFFSSHVRMIMNKLKRQ